MAVTAQDVRDHFAEFEACSDTVIERWLAYAVGRVNATQWGGRTDEGVLWLTAHFLKVASTLGSGLQSAAGPASSVRVGDLATTYAIPPRLARSWLSSTTYGAFFVELMATIFPTRVLGGTCCSSNGDT